MMGCRVLNPCPEKRAQVELHHLTTKTTLKDELFHLDVRAMLTDVVGTMQTV